MLFCNIQATEIRFQQWRAHTNGQTLARCFLAGGAADVLNQVGKCVGFASLCKVSAILANVPGLWDLWRSCSTARRGCGTAAPGSEVPFSCGPILAAPRLLPISGRENKGWCCATILWSVRSPDMMYRSVRNGSPCFYPGMEGQSQPLVMGRGDGSAHEQGNV